MMDSRPLREQLQLFLGAEVTFLFAGTKCLLMAVSGRFSARASRVEPWEGYGDRCLR